MQYITDYIRQELEHYETNYPWKLTVHHDVKSIYLYIYLPIKENEHYELLIHFDGLVDMVMQSRQKIVVPLFNQADAAEKEYLDHLLLGVKKVAHHINNQIQEILEGKRISIDYSWPSEDLEQMMLNRQSIDRYDTQLLTLGDA